MIREKERENICVRKTKSGGGRVVNRERTIPRQNNGRQPMNESKRKKAPPPKGLVNIQLFHIRLH